MQLLKALWFVNLFSFVLTLIYVWSRILVVSARIKAIVRLMRDIEALSASSGTVAKPSGERAAGSPAET
ncbi:MAG: hypothetical protein GF344_18165 [Chitinivibrionales bacterium]|nr:hypothetical protein [Chitinivibrionales bacterium]